MANSATVTKLPKRQKAGTSSKPAKLTATRIEGLPTRPQRYEIYDPGLARLMLRVEPSGSKIWMFRYRWDSKRTKLKLGAWPNMGLADAREQAVKAGELLDRGINPKAAKRPPTVRKRAPTPHPDAGTGGQSAAVSASDSPFSIESLIDEFLNKFIRKFRKRPEYVERVLRTEVLTREAWAGRDVRTITSREVVELLDRVVDRGSPVMANRVAAILAQLFKYGIQRALITSSPVLLLMRPGGKEQPRERALTGDELRLLFKHVGHACLFTRSKLPASIRILLLTGQRVGELRRAEWSHIDFDSLVWEIPKDNSKTGVAHLVPLSAWAAAEFKELKALARKSRWVLPSKDASQPLDEKRLTRSLARCRERFRDVGIREFQLRDLRRTCRTGLSALKDLGFKAVESHVAERVLNHKQPKIAGTYDKYEYLRDKREALDSWAAHLANLAGRSGGAR